MSLRRTKEEDIWHWYKLISKFREQKLLSITEFCKINNIEYKTFTNKIYRLNYKKYSDPEVYNKYFPIVRKFVDSGLGHAQFLKSNDIPRTILKEMGTHIRYLDFIEKIRPEMESKEMNFIEVPKIVNLPTPIEQHSPQEVIKKQNDLELTISKGIKVIVSAEINSESLIKIIEFLKDL